MNSEERATGHGAQTAGTRGPEGSPPYLADHAAPARPPRRALPGRLVWLVWAMVAGAWIVLDQATKVIAVAELSDRTIDLGVMDLRLVYNPNAAFGIPGFPGMFVIIGVVVLVLIIRALRQTDRLSIAAVYGLITGGAMGNVIDRVIRAPGFPSGHVVDMFDLRWWPVFNVADAGITVGAVLMLILVWRIEQEQRRLEQQPRRRAVRPDTASPRR
jgi:signal peptidase II